MAKQTGIYSMKMNNQNKSKGEGLMNRKKINSTVIISILLIFVALAAAPAQAGVMFTVSGTLYINYGSGFGPADADVEVILSFAGGDFTGTTNSIGYYEINDNNMPVETGCLFVNLSGTIYSAEDTQGNNVCIQVVPEPPYIDNLDLYVNLSQAPPPNNPPNVPNAPGPYDGETGVDINHDLNWTGGDPDIPDTVTYDIYFGNTSSPPKIVDNNSDPLYDPGELTSNTTYYWKIVAWDDHGASTEGPEWTFDTILNSPPYIPSAISPSDGATGVSENQDLSWTGGDPDAGDIVTYDVYFGTTTPTLVANNQSGTSYALPTLTYLETYTWKIVAWDDHGASTEGPEWIFKIRADPGSGGGGGGGTGGGSVPLPPPPEPEPEPILNNPPANLTVTGSNAGDADTNYTFTANATDPDENDTICYTFDWGDDTNDTVTDYFASGVPAEAIHQWTAAGIYTIQVYAMDAANATSGTESLTILIDVIYVKDIGYIIDDDGDGVYENFYNNDTGNTTATEYDETNDSYLLNSDGAEGWEWVYELPTDTLTEYTEEEAPPTEEPEQDNTIWYMLGLGMLIVILILLGIYYYLKKKTQKKSKKKK